MSLLFEQLLEFLNGALFGHFVIVCRLFVKIQLKMKKKFNYYYNLKNMFVCIYFCYYFHHNNITTFVIPLNIITFDEIIISERIRKI